MREKSTVSGRCSRLYLPLYAHSVHFKVRICLHTLYATTTVQLSKHVCFCATLSLAPVRSQLPSHPFESHLVQKPQQNESYSGNNGKFELDPVFTLRQCSWQIEMARIVLHKARLLSPLCFRQLSKCSLRSVTLSTLHSTQNFVRLQNLLHWFKVRPWISHVMCCGPKLDHWTGLLCMGNTEENLSKTTPNGKESGSSISARRYR